MVYPSLGGASKMTTYLVTMVMLLNNELADQRAQDKLDLMRVECGTNQKLQHQLDVRQRDLNDARNRNMTRIAEIARLN